MRFLAGTERVCAGPLLAGDAAGLAGAFDASGEPPWLGVGG